MQTKIKILMTLEKAHVIMLSENIKKKTTLHLQDEVDFKSSKNALKIKGKTLAAAPDVQGKGHAAPGRCRDR